MSKMKYLTSILGVAVLMVVVAACGSDESSTLPSSDDGSSLNTVTPTSVAEPATSAPSSPLVCIIFEETEYTSADGRTVTPGQPTAFVVEGIEIDVINLELVGNMPEAQTRCMDQVWEVYRSNEVVDAEAIYTFTPEYSIVNPEDGHISEISAVWERWTPVDR